MHHMKQINDADIKSGKSIREFNVFASKHNSTAIIHHDTIIKIDFQIRKELS